MAKVIVRDMNGDLFMRDKLTGIDFVRSATHDCKMVIKADDLTSVWEMNFKDLKTYYKKDEVNFEEVDLIDFVYDRIESINVLCVEGRDGRVTINFR